MGSEEHEGWQPSRADLALWRVLDLSGRPMIAARCLTDGELSMGTTPPDKLFVDAFILQHGGHEVVLVTDEMNDFLREQRARESGG